MFSHLYKRDIQKSHTKGFTLIELMVVISIIGMLSSVSLVALNKVRIRAQVSRVQQELRQIGNAIIIVRNQSDKLLWQINSPPFPLPPGGSPLTAQFGHACTTACLPECSPPNNLRNTTNTCYTTWAAVLDAIEANSGGIFPNLDGFRRDVWGSPYLIDENEGVADSLCHPDYIKSVGPDGAASGGDNIDLILSFNSVGKVFPIPFPNNGSPDYLYTGGGLPDYSAGYRCQCTQKGICVQI